MSEREARIVTIATRLLTTRLDDPTWSMDSEAFRGAIQEAVVLEALSAPDWVLDQIAPHPVKSDG